MELDLIKLQTTWNDAAGSINTNFSKIQMAIASLEGGSGGLNEDELLAFLVENGYITTDDLSDYYTKYEVNELIDQIKAGDIDLANYYTKEEIDGKGFLTSASLVGYATTGYVSEAISDLNIGQFATKTALAVTVEALSAEIGKKANADDVADTYATKTALSTLQSSHDTLRAEFDALDDALNDDVSGKINTWNEIVDFLNEYSGSEDLATIISKINAEIAKRAFQSDLTALATRVDIAEGNITSLTNGKADKSELSKYVLLEKASQTIKGDITIEGNLIITGDVASGGEGGNTSAEGTVTGVTVSGVDYTSVEAGLLDLTDLMANYALKSASTKVSVSPSLASGKPIGVISVDGDGTTLYAPATYAWSEISEKPNALLFGGTSSQFLKADGSVDSTSYLPTSGGAMNDGVTISWGSNSTTGIRGNSAGSLFLQADTLSQRVSNGTYYTILNSGNYSDYALPLSGGTITSAAQVPLMINSSNTSLNAIVFGNNAGDALSYVGYSATYGTRLYDYGSSSWLSIKDGVPSFNNNTLLHSGNVGEYALKVDGSNAMTSPLVLKHDTPRIIFRNASDLYGSVGFESGELKAQLMIGGSWAWHTLLHSGNIGEYKAGDSDKLGGLQSQAYARCDYDHDTNEDVLTANQSGMHRWPSSAANMPTGGAYGNSLVVRGNNSKADTLWILYAGYSRDALYFRRGTTTSIADTDWKTIAFTDSNVASATKLATARNIWGQSFDGTGDVTGDIHLNQSDIYWHSDKTHYCIESVPREAASPYLKIAHYGGIHFYTQSVEMMRIADNGNVGIGITDPQYKLDVLGDLCVNRNNHGYNNTTFRINCIDNQVNLYAEDLDDAICRLCFYTGGKMGMMLSPTGNVGIGTGSPAYKLDVAGTGRFTEDLTVEGNASIAAVINLTRNAGVNYIWANKAGSTIALGVQDAGSNGTSYASLMITASTLFPGYRNGVVSLGSGSYRWLTIYGVNGDFSNAVTVSGTFTANSGATITGDVTINGNLIVSGDVASGGTGQDTPSDGNTSTSTSGVLTLTGEIPQGSNIPQSSLDAIGLTDQVIADLLIGKYHHVMYTSGITTYCFVVSGKYNSDYKAFVLYWGDDYMDEFMGYSFASSANGWYIEFYEI